MASPDRFRKLDGLDWLTTLAASVTGGCVWLFSPLLVAPLISAPAFAGKMAPSYALALIMLAAFGAALAIHEGGHFWAAHRLGIPIHQVRVSFFRGAVELEGDLSRQEELWVTLAGPLANLAATTTILLIPWLTNRWAADVCLAIFMTNMGTAAMNLMPFRMGDEAVSDGERVLAILFED